MDQPQAPSTAPGPVIPDDMTSDFLDGLASAVASFRCRMRGIKAKDQAHNLIVETTAEFRGLVRAKVKQNLDNNMPWSPADDLIAIAAALMQQEAYDRFDASLRANANPSMN